MSARYLLPLALLVLLASFATFHGKEGRFYTRTFNGNKVEYFQPGTDTSQQINPKTGEITFVLTEVAPAAVRFNGADIHFGYANPDSTYPPLIKSASDAVEAELLQALRPALLKIGDGRYFIYNITAIIDAHGHLGATVSDGFGGSLSGPDSIRIPLAMDLRTKLDSIAMNTATKHSGYPVYQVAGTGVVYELDFSATYDVSAGQVSIPRRAH